MENLICECHKREFKTEKELKNHLYSINYYKDPIKKEKFHREAKIYRDKNKEIIATQARKVYRENLTSWEGFIPLVANCQICGKEIYFNRGTKRKAIHFDHKNSEVIIKKCPSSFLAYNKRTPEKEKIWKSCKFGMLCNNCNRFLPTKNREKFVEGLTKYVFNTD